MINRLTQIPPPTTKSSKKTYLVEKKCVVDSITLRSHFTAIGTTGTVSTITTESDGVVPV